MANFQQKVDRIESVTGVTIGNLAYIGPCKARMEHDRGSRGDACGSGIRLQVML